MSSFVTKRVKIMVILDLIIVTILIVSLVKGYRDGVVVQISAFVGLFVGVYLAFRYAAKVGGWVTDNSEYVVVVGFAITLIVVLVGVAMLAKGLRGVLKLSGLGLLDKLGGVVFSLLKTGLIVGLLIYCFSSFNSSFKWVEEEKLEQSKLYNPLLSGTKSAFPYMNFAVKQLIPDNWGEEPNGQTDPDVQQG